MYSTKNIIFEINQVPSYWAFKYYLNLEEDLKGQSVKLKSIWNPLEKTPSFCIYVNKKENQYYFKDFSSGKYGDKITLVMEMFDIDYSNACNKIVNDYNSFGKNNTITNYELNFDSKWQVTNIKFRDWNTNDAKYWLSYRIGKTLLEKYNVKPVLDFEICRDTNTKINIQTEYIYAYCDSSNEAYKIYQPFKKNKFLKIKPYIQGLDQLDYNHPYLVICSSLKDAMCLKSFGYNLDVIAPDSENTLIKAYIIENLMIKYKKIITLFDNDKAGLNAIQKYRDVYNIDGTFLEMSKDISDSLKEFGYDKTKTILTTTLKTILKKE